jgi:hypothetical protein
MLAMMEPPDPHLLQEMFSRVVELGSQLIPAGVSFGEWLTIFSVVVATSVGVATILQQRAAYRREHTLEIMLKLFTGDSDAKFQKYLNKMIHGEPRPDGAQRIDDLAQCLTIFEFISLATRVGALDFKFVAEMRAPLMVRTYDFCKAYIDGQRLRARNPMLYEHLEWLVEKKFRRIVARRGVASLRTPPMVDTNSSINGNTSAALLQRRPSADQNSQTAAASARAEETDGREPEPLRIIPL